MGSFGALIMGFFGALFASMTLHWQFGKHGLMLATPFLIFGLIGLFAAYAIRQPGEGIVPSERGSRAIRWSSIGEGIGLFLAANILINPHHPELLLPVMALIVGLHFLPIAYAAPFSAFYVLGGALIVFGLIGLVIPAPSGGMLSGFASACGLWIASALAIRRDLHFKRENPPAAHPSA